MLLLFLKDICNVRSYNRLIIMSLAKLVQKVLPDKKIDIFGKDSLMMTSFPYYQMTFILIMSYSLLWNHAWSVMAFIYVLLPLLDEICTQDTRNPTEQ